MITFSVGFLSIIFLGSCYAKPEPIISEDDPDRTHFIIPYVVGIEEDGEHMCGGSIIRAAVVLTAAHCIAGRDIDSLQVRAGSLYINKDGVTRSIRDYVIHPDYERTSDIDYDVAVLQLNEPFNTKHPRIATIKLAKEHVPAGTSARISGWGRLGPSGSYPERIRSVLIEVANDVYCKEFTDDALDPKICAGGTEGLCDGDSGGPLVVNARQIGIGTHTIEYCTYEGFPQIYSDVVFLRNWIEGYANSYQAYFS